MSSLGLVDKKPDPVFIIGAARSGTKFLRDILAASPEVIKVPYDINYVWRRGNEHLEHDELDTSAYNHYLSATIKQDIYQQAEYVGINFPKALVEKTVSNTLRVPFVKLIFPQARYVYLIRNGRDVVESSYRCWQQRPDLRYLLQKARTFQLRDWRYALKFIGGMLSAIGSGRSQRMWGPCYKGMIDDLRTEPLEIIVARQWRRCIEASLASLAELSPEKVFVVRYEELIQSSETIVKLTQFLNIDSKPVKSAYQNVIKIPEFSRWNHTFDLSQRKLIMNEIGETMERLGYSC
jgi:hypothetical protein